jgi:hypothetical protein
MLIGDEQSKKNYNDFRNLECTGKLQKIIEEVKSIGGISSASLKQKERSLKY